MAISDTCEGGSGDRARAVAGAGTSSSCPCSSSVSPMVSSVDWNRPTSPHFRHFRWLNSFRVYKKARTRKTSEARRPAGVPVSYSWLKHAAVHLSSVSL